MSLLRRSALVCLAVSIVVIAPTPASAQDSHWGVVASVTPQWKVPQFLETLFDGTVDIKGTDFAIGIARGRELSGDWGVSYIHKKLKDGSRVESFDTHCFSNGCFQDGTSILTQGVTLDGLEVHKYVPFVTIHQRLQIGMNFASGIGKFKGNLERREFRATQIPPFTSGPGFGRQDVEVTTEPASELIQISSVPLLKVQAAIGVLVAPGFKIRAQGGIDLPGYEVFSISGVYFFGAK